MDSTGPAAAGLRRIAVALWVVGVAGAFQGVSAPSRPFACERSLASTFGGRSGRDYDVSWTATDQGTEAEDWIEFDLKHYQSMVNDGPRTDLFLAELEARLASYPRGTATVLDLGTGPFALFALHAARLGAKRVYAVEAVPGSAARARKEVHDAAVYGGEFDEGVVEVIEGFSTDVDLPEKVDVLVSEIAGSVASEEGVYATILDANGRAAGRG